MRSHCICTPLAVALSAIAALAAAAGGCSSSAATTKCEDGLGCGDGHVQVCTTTDGAGACSKIVYSYGGKDYTCASCGDCAQAATAIASACTRGAGDGGGPIGAGGIPDASGGGQDAASADASSAPVTQCQAPQSCANGASYQVCVTTSGSACVSAKYEFDDGTAIACASCVDCVAAATTAATRCAATSGDAGSDADAGNPCGIAPALHPETQAGVYCPFTSMGKTICAANQECCIPPIASGQASICAAEGTACPVAGSLAWRCEDAIDCAGSAAGSVCCGAGAVQLDNACGFYRGAQFQGSHCAASCGNNEVIICETAAQCPPGKTCTPFKTDGLNLGACL